MEGFLLLEMRDAGNKACKPQKRWARESCLHSSSGTAPRTGGGQLLPQRSRWTPKGRSGLMHRTGKRELRFLARASRFGQIGVSHGQPARRSTV